MQFFVQVRLKSVTIQLECVQLKVMVYLFDVADGELFVGLCNVKVYVRCVYRGNSPFYL